MINLPHMECRKSAAPCRTLLFDLGDRPLEYLLTIASIEAIIIGEYFHDIESVTLSQPMRLPA